MTDNEALFSEMAMSMFLKSGSGVIDICMYLVEPASQAWQHGRPDLLLQY